MQQFRELRCFCAKSPLLARYSRDSNGDLYLHIKVYKQGRIFGEIILTSGVARVRCRECLRWHTINLQHQDRVLVQPEEPPASLGIS